MTKPMTKISLGHGGGGKMTGSLIKDTILPRLDRGRLGALPDSVVLDGFGDRIAYTTDSFVVSPIFFPGGDIGSLSIHGTCNDIACSGARPLFISMGLILEEGFELAQLERILDSAAKAADEAGVQIVTGDTKVVPRGAADKIFINTSGIGRVEAQAPLGPEQIQIDDKIIVSGPVGAHGMAVMLSRAEFSFSFDIQTDSASVWPIVERLLPLKSEIRFLRDPTRGGLAATLNEVAQLSNKGIEIEESSIPVDQSVNAAAEMLGIDPLQAANEGKIVAVVAPGSVDHVMSLLVDLPIAEGAAVIGTITDTNASKVVMKTRVGGTRILAEPSGELLPRIC